MNNAAAGLDLKPGDEVLSTTHEHIGGRCCWELLAKRRGIVYRTFAPPLDPASDDELCWRPGKAHGHAAHPGALDLARPLQHRNAAAGAELVRWARANGIITVIDGAHPPGMLVTNLQAIDADYYATSTAQVAAGAQGSGAADRASGPDRHDVAADRIGRLGRHRHPPLRGRRHQQWLAGRRAAGRGCLPERDRPRRDRAAHPLAGARNCSTRLPSCRGSSSCRRAAPPCARRWSSFKMDGTTAEKLQGYLGAARIRTRRIAEFGYEYLRLSTHIYVLPRDIERVVNLLKNCAVRMSSCRAPVGRSAAPGRRRSASPARCRPARPAPSAPDWLSMPRCRRAAPVLGGSPQTFARRLHRAATADERRAAAPARHWYRSPARPVSKAKLATAPAVYAPTPGSDRSVASRAWHFAAVMRHHVAGGTVQIGRPPVVAQSVPRLADALRRCGGQVRGSWGRRSRKRGQYSVTRATWVCCSMTSETSIWYGSRVRRQGRSRPWRRNQASRLRRKRKRCMRASRMDFRGIEGQDRGSMLNRRASRQADEQSARSPAAARPGRPFWMRWPRSAGSPT